jgi:hypothetical protein
MAPLHLPWLGQDGSNKRCAERRRLQCSRPSRERTQKDGGQAGGGEVG